jgi:hypothetical protein
MTAAVSVDVSTPPTRQARADGLLGAKMYSSADVGIACLNGSEPTTRVTAACTLQPSRPVTARRNRGLDAMACAQGCSRYLPN